MIDKNSLFCLTVSSKQQCYSTHSLENERITNIFCSFEKIPRILSFCGQAKEIKQKTKAGMLLFLYFAKPQEPINFLILQ
jgi:hypothetical protein